MCCDFSLHDLPQQEENCPEPGSNRTASSSGAQPVLCLSILYDKNEHGVLESSLLRFKYGFVWHTMQIYKELFCVPQKSICGLPRSAFLCSPGRARRLVSVELASVSAATRHLCHFLITNQWMLFTLVSLVQMHPFLLPPSLKSQGLTCRQVVIFMVICMVTFSLSHFIFSLWSSICGEQTAGWALVCICLGQILEIFKPEGTF